MATLADQMAAAGYKPNSGVSLSDQMAQAAPAPAATPAPQQPDNTYGATFPATGNESPLSAGLKAAGNLPSSGLNLAKNAISLLNPKTWANLGAAVTGGLDTAVGKVVGHPIQTTFPGATNNNETTDAFHGLVQGLQQRYGSLDNLRKTSVNDPVGLGSDILSLISGGAALVGKGAEVSNAIGRVGGTVTNPLSSVASSVASKGGEAAKFLASQETGLEPSTLSTAAREPAALTAAQKSGLNRATLGTDLQTTIDSRINHLSDLGKGYDSVRSAQTPVTLPEDWFSKVLNDHKIELNNGKIGITKESQVLSPADTSALQHFYDLYGKDTTHSGNSYLNTREALTQLAKYDSAKTGNLERIARDARTELNRYRNQLPGIQKLDEQYSPEVTSLKQIKSEWINPKTGELKDTAINRIANAGNTGNDARLARLEQLQPGVTKQIQLLKAIEDIQKASGIKVGTYARIGTAATGYALGGPVGAAAAAIMTAPEIAVPLIKGLGLVGEKVKPLLQALHSQASDINNFRLPQGASLGLSTQDVSRFLHPEDKGIMTKFIDDARGTKSMTDAEYNMAEKLAQHFGISMDKGRSGVASAFEQILQGQRPFTGTRLPGMTVKKAPK